MAKKERLSDEEVKALAIALELGCNIHANGKCLYRSKSQEYTILNFDSKRGDMEEESYPDINDGIQKFAQRAKL